MSVGKYILMLIATLIIVTLYLALLGAAIL